MPKLSTENGSGFVSRFGITPKFSKRMLLVKFWLSYICIQFWKQMILISQILVGSRRTRLLNNNKKFLVRFCLCYVERKFYKKKYKKNPNNPGFVNSGWIILRASVLKRMFLVSFWLSYRQCSQKICFWVVSTQLMESQNSQK